MHAYANTDDIVSSWDAVLRFIATIRLKEATAFDIFRRLNSYSKQHSCFQALKSFEQIPKNLFILRYIDEPPLRMSIEKVPNGIEHVHRFTRAVSVGSPRKFLQAEKEDQEMAEACKRFIKNPVICWNYLLLTQKLAEIKGPPKRTEVLQAVEQGSAASWDMSTCWASTVCRRNGSRIRSESSSLNSPTKQALKARAAKFRQLPAHQANIPTPVRVSVPLLEFNQHCRIFIWQSQARQQSAAYFTLGVSYAFMSPCLTRNLLPF